MQTAVPGVVVPSGTSKNWCASKRTGKHGTSVHGCAVLLAIWRSLRVGEDIFGVTFVKDDGYLYGAEWVGIVGMFLAFLLCMMLGVMYGAVGTDTQSTYQGLFIPQEATRW